SRKSLIRFPAFSLPGHWEKGGHYLPCPHFEVNIIQRSTRQSAVASAAYQSGERLFSEYDQKQKYYSHKSEIVHTEIMLPPHAPPEYADLIRDYCREFFVSKGMIADFAIHDKYYFW